MTVEIIFESLLLDLFDQIRIHRSDRADQLEDELSDLLVLLSLDQRGDSRQQLWEVEVRLDDEAGIDDDGYHGLDGHLSFDRRCLILYTHQAEREEVTKVWLDRLRVDLRNLADHVQDR